MLKVEKVYAYITREDQLLVFKHVDFPRLVSRFQGAHWMLVRPPRLREAGEETGLRDLVVEKYLGRDEYIESRHCVTDLQTLSNEANFCKTYGDKPPYNNK